MGTSATGERLNKKMTRYRWRNGTLKVEAIKIVRLSTAPPHLIAEDVTLDPIKVTGDWIALHRPEAGGYFLRYENGWTGFMPAQLFEREFEKVP